MHDNLLRQNGQALEIDRIETAERVFLAGIIANGSENLQPASIRLLESAPDSFVTLQNGAAARVIRRLRDANESVNIATLSAALANDFEGKHAFLSALASDVMPIEIAESEAEMLWEHYKRRQTIRSLDDAKSAVLAAPEQTANILATLNASLEPLWNGEDDFDSWMEARRFRVGNTPPCARAVYLLCDAVVFTPGNLGNVIALAKEGKSNVVGAMIAAAISGNPANDCLGFRSVNENGLALIHFDTEQSPENHDKGNRRTLRRANLTAEPSWLYSFWLAGATPGQTLKRLHLIIKRAARAHGGVHSVIIDGIADLVNDVNDAAECNELVAVLHALAIEYDCPIICVIHFNPGTEKSRGHLGSQLERKAETNLRLDKKDGVTTIWSDKQRGAPIPKGTGPCFQWSDEAQMHVSVESGQSVADKEKLESFRELASDLFHERSAMRYTALKTTLINALSVKEKTAEKKITDLIRLGLIEKSVAGLWVLTR